MNRAAQPIELQTESLRQAGPSHAPLIDVVSLHDLGGIMPDALALNGLLPFVPAAGALFLIFAAFYSRTLQKALGRGLDKISALGKVPNKERLHTIEVFENVLKVDELKTERLTADQRFKLIERTFEERRDSTRRRFILLIVAAAFLLVMAVLWFYYIFTTSTSSDMQIRRALEEDPEAASKALADKGFYAIGDARLVEALTRVTGFSENRLNEAIERFQKLDSCSEDVDQDCNRALAQLRSRSRSREAPFTEPGIFFDVGRSGGVQPRRFFINATANFPFKQSALEVRNPLNDRSLVLWPRVALTTETRRYLVHLNDQQILQLFGQKDVSGPSGTASTIRVAIRPVVSSNPQLTDPACPTQWEGNDRLCSIDEEDILLDRLLDKLSA